MPNTYTQLYIHLVFAVKRRQSLVLEEFREELQQYITGIVQNKGHKLLAIYIMPDHAHILIGHKPSESISILCKVIKSESTNFIRAKKLSKFAFNWQAGYGAFSHSRNELSVLQISGINISSRFG